MAVYRTQSAVYAAILETTFNGGGTFTDDDVIEVTSDSNLKPEIDAIERKATCNSFIAQPKVAGKESGSGTIGVELIGSDDGLLGSVILRVALGIYEEPGTGTGCFIGSSDDGTTPANEIHEADASEDGTAYLYKLNKPCGSQESLAIKMMLGCDTSDSQSLIFTGVVPNSVQFDFPVADIATISFDIGGAGFQTASGETLLTANCSSANPFVGKNATFTVDDTTYEAKDLSFTIENTVSDREAITNSGISDKVITSKLVKGSLKITFENWDELDKFKNNADAKIYLEMTNGADKFAIYIPKARYTSVAVEDDDGVLVNTIEFEAAEDATLKEALLIGYEKA